MEFDGLHIYIVVTVSALVDSGKGMILQLERYHATKWNSKPWTWRNRLEGHKQQRIDLKSH
jgi:hypothetical protein